MFLFYILTSRQVWTVFSLLTLVYVCENFYYYFLVQVCVQQGVTGKTHHHTVSVRKLISIVVKGVI